MEHKSSSGKRGTIVRGSKGLRFMTATRLSESDNRAKIFLWFERARMNITFI